MTATLLQPEDVVTVENPGAAGPFLIVCEHASNAFPAPFGSLGLTEAQQLAHIAWDPGALGLARGLAARLGAPLVAARVSRLIYDLNRPPHSAGAMPARSETHDIPGNAGLTDADRLARTEAIYLPFHAALRAEIARRLARGRPPVIVTVHSFTPIWHGTPRSVEFGVIHDADPSLALATVAAARKTGLRAELNQPYSAADEVTHTLRLQASPLGLANVMLEIRNDLIASSAAQEAMAETLAPVLHQTETDQAGTAA
ncbi:N-formylglutamate amidohydrolase [Frigidibacter sp.]|uniref:N-formylglutamate amidohydrolase n=1 Tax=Frigidibacter sp. TaxID=2586418 RepID=UPI002734A5D1|nr:N-formylglutamate amidohydrolase [Frigidibacter sp.]MDP3339015.1 N-formylglutamate amidohydrolase [Frigidibacter sp.]